MAADHRDKSLKNGESQELENILDQLSETDAKRAASPKTAESNGTDDVFRKPSGKKNQPEDLEGMLEQISEKPVHRSPGIRDWLRKLIRLFKRN